MAGHSKWANIKHRKSAQDAKRGKVFTKLIRAITIAAKQGGAELEMNAALRLAVDKAYAANMPKDTVERAIKRGAGSGEGDNLEEVRYEGYAPGGVAVIVDCMTDNRNRTVGEVRHAFTKQGGNLGTDGSVAYLFNQRGQFIYAPGVDEDRLMEVALELGAEDIQTQPDGSAEVITTPESFHAIKDGLEKAGLKPDNAELSMIPLNYIALDAESSEKYTKLMDALEDLDDVQEVYSNAELPEEQ